MTQESNKKYIIITLVILIITLLLFEFTDFDIDLQSLFYNPVSHSWILSKDNKLIDIIFYSGFKKLFIIFATIITLLTIFLYIKKIDNEYKKGLLIISLSLVFIPSLAILKNYTNVPCPCDIKEFGGVAMDIKVLEHYPENYIQKHKYRCFPAGHATMGFSLMSLYFLFKNPRNQTMALLFGISIGAITGGYKILIGDHFLSHTLVTMISAWLIILTINLFVNKMSREQT